MDLVTCEAPLDNSFQKDRRELVNKGSLGRRRKPSRSNLKLILSPTSDPSDTVVISSSQLNDSSSYENRIPTGHLNGSILSNQQEAASFDEFRLKNSSSNHLRSVKSSSNRTTLENAASSQLLSETILSNELEADDEYRANYSSNNHQQRGKYVNHHLTVTNGTSSERINEVVLDNQQENDTTDQFRPKNTPVNQTRSVKSGNYHLTVVNGASPENINDIILSSQQDVIKTDQFSSNQSSSIHSRSGKPNNNHITLVNGTSLDHIGESILVNNQKAITGNQFHVKNSSSNHVRNIKSGNPHLTVACNNYRDVIASINQLQKVNSDNHRILPNSHNHHVTERPISRQDVVNGNHQVAYRTNNNINSKYCPQFSETRNNQNLKRNNNQENITDSHKAYNSNCYKRTGTSRTQKVPDFSNQQQQLLSLRNQQQTVASRNHQNVVTFSNRRQIVTSTPIQSKKHVEYNGKQNVLASKGGSKLYIEPSLPRTCNQPNLVEEAQQFSIEAKLRRKKSEAQGRSAVLIQTWERRTQSDPFGKSKTSSKNRFGDKENADAAMPDSYICSKYKGSLQNGDGIERDDLATNVRDLTPDKAMLQRVPDSRPGRIQPPKTSGKEVTVNGKSSGQEPEWVSLSKKLCAKFVEGHIEAHSADSYSHEELEGVKEVPFITPLPQTHSGDKHLVPKEIPKKKVVAPLPLSEEGDIFNSNGPPWIHLSRKLCNKFIEEHIEYPPITNGHFVEIVPELVEPNGDVRIIEKIGKPKVGKSKQKKDCVPEWVSLSKKLRAKFIESHIDDPDTISLDNQLNASDPDETSSESLSDVSQDVPEKKTHVPSDASGKNFTIRQEVKSDTKFLENGNEFESRNSAIFPEKEVCWEYQEMEFDQESNSGTFQEAEYYDEPLQEARIQRNSIPQDNSNNFSVRETVSYSNNNPQCFQTPECFNNDVMFAPRCDNDERSSNSQQNKFITVKIISHSNKDVNSRKKKDLRVGDSSGSVKRDTIHGSFFNLSTWEETHNRGGGTDNHFNGKKESLSKDSRSKSMDNLYDSLDDSLMINDDSCTRGERISEYYTTSTNNTEYSTTSTNTAKYSTTSTNDANYSTTSTNKAKYPTTSTNKAKYPTTSTNNAKYPTTSTNNVKYSSTATSNDKYPITVTNNDECPIKSTNRTNYSTTSTNNSEYSTTSTNNAEYSATSTNSTKQVEKSLSNENTELFFEEFETKPQNLDKKSPTEENIKYDSEESHTIWSETRKKSSSRSQCQEKDRNILSKTGRAESSSDDEVFDYASNNKKYSPDSTIYGKISSQNSPVLDKEQQNSDKMKDEELCKSAKNFKCNGMIPNSIYDGLSQNKTPSLKCNINQQPVENNRKEPAKLGMSKWITISKSEQNINRNEYSNISPHYTHQTGRNTGSTSSESPSGSKEIRINKTHFDKRYNEEDKVSKHNISPNNMEEKNRSNQVHDYNEVIHSHNFEGPVKEFDLKHKCKSLCDISYNDDSFFEENIRHHESVADISSVSQKIVPSQIEFQHFDFESEIPLCAKLVSKQNRKKTPKSVSSASSVTKNESPCPSESSHIYEDMFKETPSGPSDSEASSWKAIKDNSYYINGRSSSMNDLDYSDSCSMSVKCDYASSSENSTLQSRHSSYASSSFYVNLRDYDSHMLEPSFSKSKKDTAMSMENCSSISKSSPPTPESLRHLFTSPLSSIHSPPNRTSRLISRMPSDPQSHYYSTAAATSSAFKHGFDAPKPKPKKAERSSSIKIKDIAHGIILTFKRFQNHSKNSNVSPTQYVDVSHLAEMNGNSNSEIGKSKITQKDYKKKNQDKKGWIENGKADSDSGFLSDAQRAKARRSSSDLTGMKPDVDNLSQEKKKSKSTKKNSKDKGKKNRSKVSEPRTIPTVSRKVQQLADGTLYLVTTVSGDTALPGVYSDSPDTSSELSSHQPVRQNGESNC